MSTYVRIRENMDVLTRGLRVTERDILHGGPALHAGQLLGCGPPLRSLALLFAYFLFRNFARIGHAEEEEETQQDGGKAGTTHGGRRCS